MHFPATGVVVKTLFMSHALTDALVVLPEKSSASPSPLSFALVASYGQACIFASTCTLINQVKLFLIFSCLHFANDFEGLGGLFTSFLFVMLCTHYNLTKLMALFLFRHCLLHYRRHSSLIEEKKRLFASLAAAIYLLLKVSPFQPSLSVALALVNGHVLFNLLFKD